MNGRERTRKSGQTSILLILTGVLALATLMGCGAADTVGTRKIRREMKQNDIEGMIVAVTYDDGRSWTAGFGSAGEGRDITPETPMLLASVTKLFTAIAVMTLVEDNLVDLDESIGSYVPAMSGYTYPGSPEPTVRDLLTHHGGLPSDLLKGVYYDGPADDYKDAFMEQIPMIASEPATEPPGVLYHYSNSGFLLLGALVSEVSGGPYADYVEEEILVPLGMDNSGFLDPRTTTNMSAGFADGQLIDSHPVTGLPVGGLAASSDDLAKFMAMILNHGLTEPGHPFGF